MRQEDEEAIAERNGMSNPYAEAGFGVGEVLGRGAAKRQQEILTGAEYSANMPPPGYRPGFDPEYLYFGDPRYSDYAALLPGVYGSGYSTPGGTIPGGTAGAGTAGAGTIGAGTAGAGIDAVANATANIGGFPVGSLDNFTQADIEQAMGLISSGQYDIYSLADALKIDRGTAMTAYDKYLRDTYGMGTFNPNVDQLSEEDIQKYYGIANQQAYNPEQIARIFGIPLDQSRSFLTQQYFGGIPVDEDYSDNEAQQVYDLYSSGRMGVTGISNYFGIPSADVQRILGDIEGAGGLVANIPSTTATANTATANTANTATANTVTANTIPATVASPLAGIEVDGDYSSTEADQVYDMYVAGQITPLQISQYFDIPLGEINTALSDIGESRRQLYGDEPVPVAQVARSTAKAGPDPDSMNLEDNEGESFTPLDFAFELYQSGTEIPQDQIKEALVYAQANGISYAEIDRMFDAPDGSAQDAAAALGLAASSGGIVGMAEGREVSMTPMQRGQQKFNHRMAADIREYGELKNLETKYKEEGNAEALNKVRLDLEVFDGGIVEEAYISKVRADQKNREAEDGGFLSKLKEIDTKLNAASDARQNERTARGRKLSDYNILVTPLRTLCTTLASQVCCRTLLATKASLISQKQAKLEVWVWLRVVVSLISAVMERLLKKIS